MFITCWSSKGGSGTTIVAAVLAGLLAAEAGPTVLIDLGGDLPAALGLPEPSLGLADWARGPSGPAERGSQGPSGPAERGAQGRGRGGLAELEVGSGRGLRLLPRGSGSLDAGLGPVLAAELSRRPCVVVDGGVAGRAEVDPGPVADLAAVSTVSLLVIRPCFLALRRAVAAPLRAGGVVVVDEPQRSLGKSDIETALGLPVVAVVPWDPAVARRVDAGLLGTAPPRGMARALRSVTTPARPAHAQARALRLVSAPAAPPEGTT